MLRVPTAMSVMKLTIVSFFLTLSCQAATTATPARAEPPPPSAEAPVTASEAEAEPSAVPVSADCSLPPETGPCKAAFKSFHFDSASGACKPFIYGGCQGNGNRFDSMQACQQSCIGP